MRRWLRWTSNYSSIGDCGWRPATLPHKDFNGPNILSLPTSGQSLMQFWPDFDAAIYWCEVMLQQSNKVRSQQWLKRSSWRDVYILCLQACREVTANSTRCCSKRALAACTQTTGESKMVLNSAFLYPPTSHPLGGNHNLCARLISQSTNHKIQVGGRLRYFARGSGSVPSSRSTHQPRPGLHFN